MSLLRTETKRTNLAFCLVLRFCKKWGGGDESLPVFLERRGFKIEKLQEKNIVVKHR